MAICNLLSLTVRKNQNYEPEAMTINQVYSDAVDSDISKEDLRDSISLNGRITDIMGNMTDEQIEAVMKVGYNNAVGNIAEILTNCKNITDDEALEIFLKTANATGAPQRLRIVRNNGGGSTGGSDNVGGDDNQGDDGDGGDTSVDDNGEMVTDTPPTTPNYTLVRKNSSKNNVSVTATTDGVTVCLENPMSNGQKYYYKVSSLKGADTTANFEVLDNGRLIINGNDVKVVAYEGQADDIFLIGNNNELHTGNGADIVRLGVSVDAEGVESNKNESFTGPTPILTQIIGKTLGNVFNNKVYLGAGNDYLYDSTNHAGGSANSIYGGDGNDAYRNTMSYNKIFTETNITNSVEDIFTNANKATALKSSNLYSLESYGQGALGDCRFIALLSSLKLSSNNLQDFGISITKSGTKYTVTFDKFRTADKYAGEGNQYSLTFDENDIWDNNISIYAHGDITVRLVEYAMNKLIGINMPKYNTHDEAGNLLTNQIHDLSTTSYNDYARYLYGTSAFSWQDNYDYSQPILPSEYWGTNVLDEVFNFDESEIEELNGEDIYTVDDYLESFNIYSIQEYYDEIGRHINTLDEIWAMYQAGTINNLTCGTYGDSNGFSDGLQICSMHAYAITNVTSSYVEVINPWDSQDRLRLDRDDFFRYFTSINVYGSDILANAPTENWNTEVLTNAETEEVSVISNNFIADIKEGLSNQSTYLYNQAENNAIGTKTIAKLNERYENMQISYIYKNTVKNNVEFENNYNPFDNIFASDEPEIYDEISEIVASIEEVKEILEDKKTLELYS